MKKLVIISVSLLMLSSMFYSCKKDKTEYPTYFYMKIPDSDSKYTLYIDNKLRGELTIMNVNASDFDEKLKAGALLINLKAGSYKIEARDISGNVKSRSTYKFSKNKTSVSGNLGGSETCRKDDGTVIGLFF